MTFRIIYLLKIQVLYAIHICRARQQNKDEEVDPNKPFKKKTETTVSGYIGTSRGMEGTGARVVNITSQHTHIYDAQNFMQNTQFMVHTMDCGFTL